MHYSYVAVKLKNNIIFNISNFKFQISVLIPTLISWKRYKKIDYTSLSCNYLKALSNIGIQVPVVAAGFEQKFLIMKFPAAGIFQKRNTIQLTAIIGIITSLCSLDKLFQYSFNLFLQSPYCKEKKKKS